MTNEEKKAPKDSAPPPKHPPIAVPNDDARNVIRESDESPAITVTMDVER